MPVFVTLLCPFGRAGSVCLQILFCWLAGLFSQPALAATPPEPVETNPPKRVVSMNLCTDQLALLLARPGQLIAVSNFAHDPDMSVLAAQAKAIPIHRGHAEEIFDLQADLVVSGTFSNRATLNMLKRLNHRVETFTPAYSFAEIRSHLLKMGRLLGQSERAQQLLDAFDHDLRAQNPPATQGTMRSNKPMDKRSIASYGANLYVQGAQTLERDMVEHAGFSHYGSKQGFAIGGRLSLETLVMDPPDLLLMGGSQNHQGIHAYAHLNHPALDYAVPAQYRVGIHPKYWICGTPFVLDAVRELAKLHQPPQSVQQKQKQKQKPWVQHKVTHE